MGAHIHVNYLEFCIYLFIQSFTHISMDSLIFISYFGLRSNAFVKIYFVLQNFPALIPGSSFIGPLRPLTDLCHVFCFVSLLLLLFEYLLSGITRSFADTSVAGRGGSTSLLFPDWPTLMAGVAPSPPGGGASWPCVFLTQPRGARECLLTAG